MDQLTGSILISTPFAPKTDQESVMLICDANKFGVLAFQINQTEYSLEAELTEEENIWFAIHTLDKNVANEHLLIDNKWFGVTQFTQETQESIALYKKSLIVSSHIFWTVPQFKNALKQMHWILGKCNSKLIFQTSIASKWLDSLIFNNIELSFLVSQSYNI